MAIFKCKICGGTLEINQGETVATCEYCGTKQTLPKLDDEKKANLFDRANHFRRNNDFDKAMSIYEQILNEDAEDAESYWSIVLCRYGIEYVEDPSSKRRVPTVNRAQFTSVFDDEDYKSAIKYADSYQKDIYEQEARAINEIQKGILAISQKEEPFDVFICYKETDNNGRRTQDSVLATELYHELTREGFKVFFARITLEDKLGIAYEPYIFAALHSSKVMVVLGTRNEYFNAVWVKNEWSRYLSLIKNGANKILIPAYRDMDPYDLPEEFSHLQAQDMSKLGFMQDLVRGIKKLVPVENASTGRESVPVQSAPVGNASAFVKRGFLALEDGEWVKADDFFEQALNQNPEDAQAYLGKLMAELKVGSQEKLADCEQPFDKNNNYQKVLRFGDEKLSAQLQGYITYINDRNEQTSLENIYSDAMHIMKSAFTESDFKAAAKRFSQVAGYKDADDRFVECLEKAANARKDALLKSVDELLDDAHHWAGKKTDIDSYRKAIAELQAIRGYKDADDKIVACKRKIEEINLKIEEEKLQQEKERLERERIAEEKKILAEKRRKRNKKIALISTAVVCVLIALVILFNTVILPHQRYTKAKEMIEAGNYNEAVVLLNKAGDYRDSADILRETIKEVNLRISAGYRFMAGLKLDGTVLVVGENTHPQHDISKWTDIIAISAGNHHAVGLKSDGTVVAVGVNSYDQCDVGDWKDIVEISAGGYHTVGLKSDGTVVAVGKNGYGQCAVGKWTDIVGISAGSYHTVGLKADGTVVAVGSDVDSKCDVGDWKDIVTISAGDSCTVGLKADGTVVVASDNRIKNNVTKTWKDIVAISAGSDHIVGLKSNGTVVATGGNANGQCDVDDWKNIVTIFAGFEHTLGLKSDGTVVSTNGDSMDLLN